MTIQDINTRIDVMQREVNHIKAYLSVGSTGEVLRELHNIEIDLSALRQQVDELEPSENYRQYQIEQFTKVPA